MWADGGDHAGIGDLSVSRDAGLGHVEDSVGAARHVSADAFGGAAEIVGQSGAPDRLVGALEKLAQIRGLAGDQIDHHIGWFWHPRRWCGVYWHPRRCSRNWHRPGVTHGRRDIIGLLAGMVEDAG